jgi:hypothetical protein
MTRKSPSEPERFRLARTAGVPIEIQAAEPAAGDARRLGGGRRSVSVSGADAAAVITRGLDARGNIRMPAPIGPSLRRVRRGCVRRGCLYLAFACAVLGGALHLPAFRAGLFVARFARLLRGSSPGTVVAAIVAAIHALRLRVRRRDDGEHHDGQRAHASPKIHPSLHAVLLWCSDRSVGRS